jgi:hypothetical protein
VDTTSSVRKLPTQLVLDKNSADFGQEVNVESLYAGFLFANMMKMWDTIDEKLKNH